VEDLMFIKVRKYFRKKKDEERPNDHDSVWYKVKKVFFPAEDSESNDKKSKIGDLRPPLVSALLIVIVLPSVIVDLLVPNRTSSSRNSPTR